MRDPEEATDGPTDPRVHPERSPGFGEDPDGLESIEVDRDVTIGEATIRELRASDTGPLDDAAAAEVLDLMGRGDAVERQRSALALAERADRLAAAEHSDGLTADDGADRLPADDGADRLPADERTDRPDGGGRETVTSALATAARTDEDDQVRQFAVEALAKIGGELAHEVALAATDDPDPWVRAEAVVALDRLDRGRHADRLERALDADHHAVRRNALISLFKLRGEGLRDELLAAAADDEERVREWAAHLLGGVDDDRADATLRRIAADDDEAEVVRSTAARSLEADAGRFRRQFTGALDESTTKLPGEDRLNRQPEL